MDILDYCKATNQILFIVSADGILIFLLILLLLCKNVNPISFSPQCCRGAKEHIKGTKTGGVLQHSQPGNQIVFIFVFPPSRFLGLSLCTS